MSKYYPKMYKNCDINPTTKSEKILSYIILAPMAIIGGALCLVAVEALGFLVLVGVGAVLGV